MFSVETLAPAGAACHKKEEVVSYLSPIFIISEEKGAVVVAPTVISDKTVQAISLPKTCNNKSNPSEYNDDSDYSDEEYESIGEGSQSEILENGVVSSGKNSLTVWKPKPSKWRKYRGMMFAIGSSLIFTAIPLLLQKRFCSRKGKAVTQRVWPLTETSKLKAFGLVLLRSFLACNALLLHYFSLKYLSMGDALTIASASPLFVGTLAKVFLGEKCGYSTMMACFFSLLGVIAIAKPPLLSGSESFDNDTMIGSVIAFGGTPVTAISFIVLPYIRKVHYSVTTVMYGGWGAFETLIIVILIPGLKIPNGQTEWVLVVGLAFLTLIGQSAIILAMKAEKAGPIALIRTTDVLFAFILEASILRKLPDKCSIIGATAIVLSVIFVGLRKWVKSLPKGSRIRRKLWFTSL